MKKTENYAMPYPEQDDYFNVEDFQDMMVSVDNLMKKISDSGSQISSDAEHLYNQTKAQMDNIQKRMNTFTSLKDGSTTGDAELEDIRVAYDGKEYGNAGEAVREQASDIHKALFGAGASIWSKAKSESTKYVAETKGICILNERFTAAGVVTKISRGIFAENESTLNLDRECSAYIVEFEKNPGTVYMPSAETVKIVSTTKIIFEANGNARCWIPVEKGQYLAVDSTATAYTSESNHVPYMLYDLANKTLECRGFGSTGSIEPVDPYSLALEYKLEYDMDDTGLVKQIDANGEAAASLKEDLGKLLKEIDIFDYDVFEKLQLSDEGKEVDVSASYKPERYKITSYIDVSDCDMIIVSAYASFAGYGVYCFYDSEKKFIKNGSLVTTIANPETDITNKIVIVPKNAKFVRVSDFYSKERRKLFVGKYNANKAERTVVKTKDKLWLLLGDSLTDNDNDLAYQRYYTIVASPYCTFDNRAVSGSGYIQNNGNSENNIMSKVNALSGNEGYDIISVFAGINDSGNNFGGHGLGVLGDTSTDTMYGAIYNVFNGLQTKFPTSFIFAITPTVTQYRHSVDNEIDQIAGAVKNVCRWLKVPVADVNANCPLKPWIDGNASEYYVDQTHPNDKGHKLIAKSIRGVFDYM